MRGRDRKMKVTSVIASNVPETEYKYVFAKYLCG